LFENTKALLSKIFCKIQEYLCGQAEKICVSEEQYAVMREVVDFYKRLENSAVGLEWQN
jgi:hypothetical protein